MTEKVLVTGGAGFIGSHIVDLLIEQGYSVVVIDNLVSGDVKNLHPQAKFYQVDIREEKVLNIFSEEKFSYVIHQAAQTTVKASLEDPQYDTLVNILGTVNLLEACRKTGVKRVVFASSAATYGDSLELPLRETSRGEISSFYGLSKKTVEEYLELYEKNFGLEFIILRYANVYGPRQRDDGEGGVVSIFLKRLAQNLPLIIYGSGEQIRDFIYVKDIARANLASIQAKRANLAFNISTGSGFSINQLAGNLAGLMGKEIKIEYKAPRSGDIYKSILDNSLALKILSWQPETSFSEGLKQLDLLFGGETE